MNSSHEQLLRVLKLARHSPYEGERGKALGVLLERLREAGLTLQDLDPTLDNEAELELRKMAGHPYMYEVVLRSSEEALLYSGIAVKVGVNSIPVIWIESHRLRCQATQTQQDEIAHLMKQLLPHLQRQLGLAQQQAMREYQERKRSLFHAAIDEALGLI